MLVYQGLDGSCTGGLISGPSSTIRSGWLATFSPSMPAVSPAAGDLLGCCRNFAVHPMGSGQIHPMMAPSGPAVWSSSVPGSWEQHVGGTPAGRCSLGVREDPVGRL